MSFSQMMTGLRKKYEGRIVFMKAGAFYIAIGSDAVFLRDLLDLKCTCYSKHVCKVGIPIASLSKYLKIIESFGYGYIVYSMDKEKMELHEEAREEGKSHTEKKENINCLVCSGIERYKDDVYMEALAKLYEKELSGK